MNFTATRQPLLAPDANLPQRDVLLDAKLMALRISCGLGEQDKSGNAECKITRVKYRFGANLRVLYDLKFGEGSVKVAARTLPNCKRTQQWRSVPAEESVSAPDFVDEDLGTAFWVFPNDRKISSLGILIGNPKGPANVTRNWTQSRIAAYAPEKCATAECIDTNGQTIAYAKVFASGDGLRIFRMYRQFDQLIPHIPRALAYSDISKTLVLEAVPGIRVADMKECGDTVYRKFGAAAGLFHRLKQPADLRRADRLDPQRMPQTLQTIINARPDVALQATRFVEKLAGFPVSGEALVCLHGDVHAKNAIWCEGRLTLIDLDQVSAGPAAVDIGSFLAGVHYKEITGQIAEKTRRAISKNFLKGYAGNNHIPSEKALRRSTAAALFAERAGRVVTRVRLDGLENMGRILAAAESILNGGEL